MLVYKVQKTKWTTNDLYDESNSKKLNIEEEGRGVRAIFGKDPERVRFSLERRS